MRPHTPILDDMPEDLQHTNGLLLDDTLAGDDEITLAEEASNPSSMCLLFNYQENGHG